MNLLDVRNLVIELEAGHGRVRVVDRINLIMNEGEMLGIVGESGSGKSLVARALMGLLGPQWHVSADRMTFANQDLLAISLEERRLYMGRHVAMIFQQPASYLDPSATIAEQLLESLPHNFGQDIPRYRFWQRRQARMAHITALLHKVGIKNPGRVLEQSSGELSDGLSQKVMIAIAIANGPQLLIADEPTTSMETITQLQILKLLAKLNQLRNLSVIHITSDIELAANWTDKVTVMYCGQAVENGPTDPLVKRPHHPYTAALLNLSSKQIQESELTLLPVVPGSVPSLQHLPIGCRFGPRCPYAQKKCIHTPGTQVLRTRRFKCHFPLNMEIKDEHTTD